MIPIGSQTPGFYEVGQETYYPGSDEKRSSADMFIIFEENWNTQ